MLGLGAGIDYSLLIIGRYREQVAAGDTPRDASAKAAATSGASVVAAGLIVMVAIAGLLVIGVPFIGKLGLAAAIGVGAVVISALTILPIMIGAFKSWLRPKKPEHVLPSRVLRALGRARHRRGRGCRSRPASSCCSIFASRSRSCASASPTTATSPSRARSASRTTSSARRSAPGSNGPFLLAVDTPKDAAETQEQLAALEEALADTPGIASVSPAAAERGRRDGDDLRRSRRRRRRTRRRATCSRRLREDVIPAAVEGTPLKVYVGGNTAGFEDFSDKVASRLPLFIGVVIGLSVLLLIAAFRSLWIPLVSAVFNLLSIGAAYGVVVAVFQEGIGASLIGADSGVPIVSFIPVMMFAILFGLSMDYNVFLLSRIHEAYNEGDGPRESVIHGMGRIGKVDPLRRPDHVRRLPGVRHPAGHHRQDVRPRPRPGDPDRRADRPARHRARRS